MYTVIVVDDESDLRRGLIRKIQWEEIGFTVIGEAENGIEALELVEELEPDLLLSDVKMPFMSGIELARQVREIRPTIQIAFLSGYDDFSYAQQAIQYNIVSYMLKPISSEELTTELYKIKKVIDDKFELFSSSASIQEKAEITNFIMPLVLDSFQGKESQEREGQLEQKAKDCGLLIDGIGQLKCTVIVTNFWNVEGVNCTTIENVNALDVILKKYVKHTTFFVENRIVSLVLATNRDAAKYLHILVEDVTQSAKRIMGVETMMGISREMNQLQHCHEAYLEAMNAMAECNREDGMIRYISDIERTTLVNEEIVQNIMEEIENGLRVGAEEHLLDVLKSIGDLIEERRINKVTFRFMLVQLMAAVYKIVYTIGDKEGIAKMEKYAPSQEQFYYEEPNLVWGKYVDYCIAVKKLISEQRTKSSSDICDKALEKIEVEFSNPDISLVSISGDISVSPNYLSALIKKSTGATFIDLLTKKRIETAQAMLINSEKKIREISEQCGYNDQHYFSYCFKKYVGVSPNGYRRKNEEEKKCLHVNVDDSSNR